MNIKSKQERSVKLRPLIAGIIAVQALCMGSAQALTINLNDIGGVTGSLAEAGFRDAANIWESLLSDNVTVNLNVGFQALGAGVLAQTGSALARTSYSNTRNALNQDATSVGDGIAIGNLAGGLTFGTLINNTSNSPNGAFSSTPYLDDDGDANNASTFMTLANARALGIFAAVDSTIDGSITFNNTFAFDFDGSDGIVGFDFVGVALHEIGHALGFISGVDALDTNNPIPFLADVQPGVAQSDDDYFSSTLDLFRFSADSVALGVTDMSADIRDKFFSIDGGATNLGLFSKGVNLGQDFQASHWADDLSIGIMDPTFASGEFGFIRDLDLVALDVIGWDLTSATSVVPLPAALPLFLTGLAGLGLMRWRRKAA